MKIERFEMRASGTFLSALDDWRRRQSDIPSRAEAVRRLVETALDSTTSAPVASEAGHASERKPSFLELYRRWLSEGGLEQLGTDDDDKPRSVEDEIAYLARDNEINCIFTGAQEILRWINEDYGDTANQLRAMLEPFLEAPPQPPKPPRKPRSKKA